MPASDVYLPRKIQQLADPVKQQPKKQKQQLVDLLTEEDIIFSGKQKQLVRSRIKKQKACPDQLIEEQDAWNMINGDK